MEDLMEHRRGDRFHVCVLQGAPDHCATRALFKLYSRIYLYSIKKTYRLSKFHVMSFVQFWVGKIVITLLTKSCFPNQPVDSIFHLTWQSNGNKMRIGVLWINKKDTSEHSISWRNVIHYGKSYANRRSRGWEVAVGQHCRFTGFWILNPHRRQRWTKSTKYNRIWQIVLIIRGCISNLPKLHLNER